MGKLLDDALIFAVEKHSKQVRKVSETPYVLHPLEVATIISGLTEDEETIAAGVLHDTVEDTGTDPEEIREKFGERVAELVASETEDKLVDRPAEETWLERKKHTLSMLARSKDINVKIMWLADKLSNIRSIYRAYSEIGDKVWKHFNQKDPKMHEWYYRKVAEYTSELKDTAPYQEFTDIIEKLFKKSN